MKSAFSLLHGATACPNGRRKAIRMPAKIVADGWMSLILRLRSTLRLRSRPAAPGSPLGAGPGTTWRARSAAAGAATLLSFRVRGRPQSYRRHTAYAVILALALPTFTRNTPHVVSFTGSESAASTAPSDV